MTLTATKFRIVSKIYMGGGVQSTHPTAEAACRQMRQHSRDVRAEGGGAYHDCRIEGWDGEEWRAMDWDGERPSTLQFIG